MLLAKNWWLFLLRGILAIVFGIVAIFFPRIAFLSLVLIFGAFALVDGIFTLFSAFAGNARSESWWWLVFEGLFGILIGVLTMWQPFAMGMAWIFMIALWAVVTGIFEIVTAIRLRKAITGEWMLILAGVISVLFGLMAAFYPGAGAAAIGMIVGIYAMIFGIIFVVLAIRLKSFGTRIAEAAAV